MKKLLVTVMLAVFLFVGSGIGFANDKPIDNIQSNLSKVEYTVVVTATPMDEAVMADMSRNSWTLITSIKHKKKYFWYFIRPAQLYLAQ